MNVVDSNEYEGSALAVVPVINVLSAALWEFNIQNKELKFSDGFYAALAYTPGEIDSSYTNFINNIVYHEDVSLLLSEAYNCSVDSSKNIEIRLFTKQGYQWFQNSFKRQSDNIIAGSLVNVHDFKTATLQLTAENKQYAAANKIARTGNWKIEADTRASWFSKEVYEILEAPEYSTIRFEGLIRFFVPEHRPIIADSLESILKKGKPFDLDLRLKTSLNNLLWVKIKALPIIDEYGKCLAVKGILQNIDELKQRETELKSSFEFVDHQNKRLQNFAYIVSHNLRSHANNLQYLVRLHQETADGEEKEEIFSHIFTISNSLNTTIEHLNQIVKIEADVKREKELIEFEPLFKNILNTLDNNIQAADATIAYDFSACPTVKYIPAYLESILHNLLTNSLKYRHPDRKAMIKCETTIKNEDVYLIFEDNGLGIDLERYGKKLFGLYQTFHENQDSHGIGLFITRNQIEALGGSIEVDSAINVGTKFTIKLGD